MSPAFVTDPQRVSAHSVDSDPIVVRRTCAHDIDQHTQQLHDWNLQYDQLDCGVFDGQFIDIRWPGMQLFVEKTTRRVRQRGHLLPNSCGIGTLLKGDGPICVNSMRSGVGSLIACDSTELDMCTPTGCTLAGLVVDAETLHADADSMSDLRPLLRQGMLLSMTPPAQALAPWSAMLAASVQAIVDRPDLLQEAGVRKQLRDDLLGGFIEAMCAAQREDRIYAADSRKRVVDRACELLLSKPDEPLSLLDVCTRVGASPRKLRYCFQDVLGLSPARYIKAVRLNAVRRGLSRCADLSLTVYDVAAQWGFWHFGHFSADYKKQFSELPSETLRRARAGDRLPH